MIIAVGASSFAEGNNEITNFLSSKGVEIRRNPFGRRMTKEETINHIKGADGLLAGLEPLDAEVFDKCPELKAIARIGVGMDNVDTVAAEKAGIRVSNTPDGPTEAVAEMTLTAMLTLLHNVDAHNRDIKSGNWKKRMGKSITEVTILVIGYGHIGRKVENILSLLGAKVIVYDKYDESHSTVSLDEGIRRADVLTLHASGVQQIITADMFKEMKNGVVILNSARGSLIDEDALFNALKEGKVHGFWGDALWSEPYYGKIIECDNAILTPHISTYTSKCRREMEMEAVRNILRDLDYKGEI